MVGNKPPGVPPGFTLVIPPPSTPESSAMKKTLACVLIGAAWVTQILGAGSKPNVIFILADDLGYGELGCYGQQVIQTPRLDEMAAEGLRFTQFYAGSTVCAPSRCVLMTGLHTGHCTVRGNGQGPEQTLDADEPTVAHLFKQAGYATALIGKWGLGDARPGLDHALPTKKGFDYFFGYLNQVHAHNYYPDFLWRNEERVPLPNVVERAPRAYAGFHGGAATKKVAYTHDLFVQEAFQWVQAHRNQPFFLYLALTIPHANNEARSMRGNGAEVPDFGIYKTKPWPDPDKGHAAMITRMDRDIGRLLDLLRDLGLAQNTLVLFTSDNGPHNESGHNIARFNPSGPLRGLKRALYEGGIRVPTIAWWPDHIPPGRSTDHIGYFGDFFATVGDLLGLPIPPDRDSISFLPTLLGEPKRQRQHRYLYWEFYEQGSRQAVRFGRWKAIRQPMLRGNVQLFDLSSDVGERHDLAPDNPAVVQHAIDLMDAAHVPDPDWRVPRR